MFVFVFGLFFFGLFELKMKVKPAMFVCLLLLHKLDAGFYYMVIQPDVILSVN